MALFEKELTVLGVLPGTELSTGDRMWIVSLGEVIDKTPQVSTRLPMTQQQQSANKINANYIVCWIKSATALPYRPGSKWKYSVSEDGTISLVELK